MMEKIDSILSEKGLEGGRHEIAQIVVHLRKAFPLCQQEIDSNLESILLRNGNKTWTDDITNAIAEYLKENN